MPAAHCFASGTTLLEDATPIPLRDRPVLRGLEPIVALVPNRVFHSMTDNEKLLANALAQSSEGVVVDALTAYFGMSSIGMSLPSSFVGMGT
jgi:hypothetical protein